MSDPVRIFRQQLFSEYEQAIDAVRDDLYHELRAKAPTRSGNLKRTIKRGDGDLLVQVTAPYAAVLNRRPPWRGWIDKAIAAVAARFNNS